MIVHKYKSVDEVITGLADYFVQTVATAIARNGSCNVVISGGSSPKKLYELFTGPAYNHNIDWHKIYFFFADERYVPFTDEASNGRMVKRAMFNSLGIAESNIFYINTGLPPAEAAKDYEHQILLHFKNKPVLFDLVLLGLGDNAHTASLFPHTSVLRETKALVQAVYLIDKQSYRITVTPVLINRAVSVAFLVYGEDKAAAVYHVLQGDKDAETYPAQLILGKEGDVHWFLDEEAAHRLKDK